MLGSFEPWCRAVGGILRFAGVSGFLENLEDLYEQADDGAAEWENFLNVWHCRYGQQEVTAAQILTDLQAEDGADLRDALPEGLNGFIKFQPPRYMEATKYVILEAGRFKQRLGKQLKARVNRRFGDEGLYLTSRADSHAKVSVWSVKSAGSAGSCGSVPSLGDSKTTVVHAHRRTQHK